jgi:hypothetical protein
VGLPAEARTKTAREREGGSNSVVESQPSKLLVAGSIPVSRSSLRSREPRASFGLASQPSSEGTTRTTRCLGTTGRHGRPGLRAQQAFSGLADLSGRRSERLAKADVAQLAERVLGKDEVTSSILVIGSRLRSLAARASFV